MKRWIGLWCGLVLAAGCGKKEESVPAAVVPGAGEQPVARPVSRDGSRPPDPAAAVAIRPLFSVPVMPMEVRMIPDLMGRVRVGETITVQGKIMGSMEPMEADRAAFLLGDEDTVASCDLLGIEERCPTPWDCHHEEPEAVARGVATVVFVDPGGAVWEMGLMGFEGLRPLSRLRVRGVVGPDSGPDRLVIHAEAVQMMK
jgi:hypothetical protein